MGTARRSLFDADPELKDELERVQSPIPITVDGFTHDEFPAAAGDIIAWTIVAFILGGLTAGFLSEAGAHAFRQLSALSARLYERRRKRTVFQQFDSHRILAVLMFEVSGVQVVVSSQALGTTFVDGQNIGTAELSRFFEQVEQTISEITKEVESPRGGDTASIYIEYWNVGGADRGWRVRRLSERINLDDVARWHGCEDDDRSAQ